MRINKLILQELLSAIQKRTKETFEHTVSGGLKHLVSSEGRRDGLYVSSITVDDKVFKIFMI
jgi:hypothetical protein